jgi:hypothetical protein
MERAPAGSCINDPLKAGCPEVTRVELVGSGRSPAAAASRAAKARSSSTKARAAQANQCAVNGEPPEILYYGGTHRARGRGYNTCTAYAQVQELYVTLQRFQSNFWASLAQGHAGPTTGGRTIGATATYDCNHQNVYAYRTEAMGYAVVFGIGYLELDYGYANHTCPS